MQISDRSRLSIGRRRWFRGVCLASVVALAIVGVTASAGGATSRHKAAGRQFSLLYVVNAGAGKLTPRAGSKRLFTLTLTQLEQHAVWFTDRPTRDSGTFPSAYIASAWKNFGFASDPPNAALSYTRDTSGHPGTEVILKLSHPRYSARHHSLTFTARWLDPTKVTDPNLARHAKRARKTPAHAFTTPSLFIDDGQPPVHCYPSPTCVGPGVIPIG